MLTRQSRIGDLLDNPIGNDLVGRLVQYAGLSDRLLNNPIVRCIRLGALRRVSGGLLDDALLDDLLALCNRSEGETATGDGGVRAWWKEAVIYQIYPRSFCDSDGDGVGDLPGVIEKLPYLSELGVTALWLSPVFDSPNDDNGYDVRDYRRIMEEFGTMADMDRLIARAHALGIRVVLDMVFNHTSDEHEWYRRALAGEEPYPAYYIFREGRGDAPPNNWRSFFSGSAWRYEPSRRAWALHLFSAKQMDLNWENPAVRREACDIVRFWRSRGVDGFRFDVINLISKTSLRDGNETLGGLLGTTGIEHYFFGAHLHEYLRELRADGLGETFAVGETPGVGPEMGKLLSALSRRELDTIFCFDHLDEPHRSKFDAYRYDLNHLKRCFIAYEGAHADTAWPSIFLENHDNPRMVSKIAPPDGLREPLAKLLALLLLTSRGTVFLYQGQELGAVNAAFEGIDQLRDVESRNRYKELIESGMDAATALAAVLPGTRDHARVPMVWDDTPNGGFTTGVPWLCADGTVAASAARQREDESSVFNFYRRLIGLRRDCRALVYGAFEPVAAARRDVFCYFRSERGQRFYVEANLSERPQRRPKAVDGMERLAGNYADTCARLRPYEAALYRCR